MNRPNPPLTSKEYSEEIIRQFIGWLCVDLPELHKTPVPSVAEAWERFKRAYAQYGTTHETGAEWQPIATAPKTGETVLLYRSMDVWDVRGYGRWEDCGGGVCGWITNGFFDPPGNLGLAAPTHWRPIPPAPRPAQNAPAEHQGMTFGCNGCNATVVLEFTDAAKSHLKIGAMEGWTSGTGGTFCPKCSAQKAKAALSPAEKSCLDMFNQFDGCNMSEADVTILAACKLGEEISVRLERASEKTNPEPEDPHADRPLETT